MATSALWALFIIAAQASPTRPIHSYANESNLLWPDSCHEAVAAKPPFASNSWPFIAITTMAILASVLSISTVIMHCAKLTRVRQQLFVILIVCFVPVYEAYSWMSFTTTQDWQAINFNILRDLYDAVVVFSFYSLLRLYIGDNEREQRLILERQSEISLPPLLMFQYRYDPADPKFLTRNKACVYQFVVLKPLMTVAALCAQFFGVYCAGTGSLKYGHAWYLLVTCMSLTLAMFSIFTLYMAVKEEIKSHNPVQKFFSIKAVIIIGFLQTLLLLTLSNRGKISFPAGWDLARMDAFVTAAEVLAVTPFLCYYFSHREYEQVKST
ncbi:hypothetical protein HDU77_000917 [Chytriomyces hyalinus]|nr:hypothetical protein HDU77_000917 [Chytriomyces hyalinus]